MPSELLEGAYKDLIEVNGWIALLVLCSIFFLDILWALCTKGLMDGEAHKTAQIGTLMYLLSAVAVTKWVENFWYIIPAILGSYAGCYFGVKLAHRKKQPL
jgi:uncharacterized membrane protein YfcA